MPNLQPTSVVMSVLYHPRPCLYHEQLLVFLTGEVSLSASLAGFLQAPSVKTQKHTNLEALNCHRSNIYILCFPLITSSFLFVFPRRADRFLTDLSETNFFTLQYKNLISLKCCFSRAGFFLLNFYNILIQTDEKAQR